MSGTTNRVPLDKALDLLTRPARACVGLIADGRPSVEPADIRYDDSRLLVRMDDASIDIDLVDEAVVVVDDGVLFFDLRAVYMRGTASRAEPTGAESGSWFELEPTTVTCWDYGQLRITDDAD